MTDRCPFCGTPGEYVTADEGTSYFAPTPDPHEHVWMTTFGSGPDWQEHCATCPEERVAPTPDPLRPGWHIFQHSDPDAECPTCRFAAWMHDPAQVYLRSLTIGDSPADSAPTPDPLRVSVKGVIEESHMEGNVRVIDRVRLDFPLDVERLARAVHATHRFDSDEPCGEDMDGAWSDRGLAAAIAREYAALASKEADQ